MLAGMKFGAAEPAGSELVGLIVAVSFAAGLNVYATVATLGLLAHAGLLDLPSGLHLLASWWVIAASGVLFAKVVGLARTPRAQPSRRCDRCREGVL
jgi:hypothetical protein